MPEVRLIDANVLLKRLQEQQKYGNTQDSRGRAKAILEVIHAPTIDAEPIRHGRWIPTEYDGYADGNPVYDAFECSECGHEHNGEEDTLTAYCPDCGARMDGKPESEAQLRVRRCTTCKHHIRPSGKGRPNRCKARNGSSVEMLLYCDRYEPEVQYDDKR